MEPYDILKPDEAFQPVVISKGIVLADRSYRIFNLGTRYYLAGNTAAGTIR
jgi:hypothetical protein